MDSVVRDCLGCGEPLTGMRADAKYHNMSCRWLARNSDVVQASERFWRRAWAIRINPSAKALRARRKGG